MDTRILRKNLVILFTAVVCAVFMKIPAQAALKAFSPTPATLNGVSLGGIPAWYQDINGVSVQPCLVPATCGLIGLGEY